LRLQFVMLKIHELSINSKNNRGIPSWAFVHHRL
jgi:hypothetical protein